MKVKELIEELRRCDQEAEVFIKDIHSAGEGRFHLGEAFRVDCCEEYGAPHEEPAVAVFSEALIRLGGGLA